MSVLDIRLSQRIKLEKQYSEIWGSHKGIAGDSSLQGCDTVSLRFEGTKILRKLSNYSPNDTESEVHKTRIFKVNFH